MGSKVEQECGRAARRRNRGACSFEILEGLDEEVPKLSGAMTRRRVDTSLGSVRRHVRDEPMAMRNPEDLMQYPRVDEIGVSTEFER